MRRSHITNTPFTGTDYPHSRKLLWLTIGGILYALSCSNPAFSEPKVKLNADSVSYKETEKTAIASSNVKLEFEDIKIEADRLILDEHNYVWSEGPLTIYRGQDAFSSSSLRFDLENNKANLTDIHVKMNPPDSKDFVYVRSKTIEDSQDVKSGENTFLTSCSLPHPHYYAWANAFNYYKDKGIMAYNVVLYTPILGIPFWLWTPFYWYEVGKRRVVWNFPTIGKKETPGWGWFMQNTIDYDRLHKKDSSIFLDWFQGSREWETKGVGLGIRHQYDIASHIGTVYGYQLKENDTQHLNWKMVWDNTCLLDTSPSPRD